MKPVIATTTIDRPREEVFDFLAVLANHEQFTDHFLVDWKLSEDGRSVDLQVNAPGPKQRGQIAVAHEEPPSSIVEHATGSGDRRTHGTWTLTEAGAGATHVEFRNDYEKVGLLDRVTAPLGRAWLKKQNARSLERLKELMERRP
jgi:hypothetical protein